MDKWELLALLKTKENEYVSGEYISKKFEVTRTSIWKNINELKTLGYKIESKTNKGYKLITPFDIFNAHELEYMFMKKNLPYQVIFMNTVDSTNNEAKRLQNINSNNIVIAATEQTGGRGRYSRLFLAKHSLGIYFTIKINSSSEKSIAIKDVTFFPLIAALSVCSAIKKLCGVELKIKWPNDLLYGDKKICGILTEASIEAENLAVTYVITGIGVNINYSVDDFPEEIKNTAISLRIITDEKYDRTKILCEIVESFTSYLSMPCIEILNKYRGHLITGRKISFSQDNTAYIGTVHDINDDGNLIVVLEDDTPMIIQSGEINFIQKEEEILK